MTTRAQFGRMGAHIRETGRRLHPGWGPRQLARYTYGAKRRLGWTPRPRKRRRHGH